MRHLRNSLTILAFASLYLPLSQAETLNLDWVDTSDNESGFQVQRSLNGGPFEIFTETPANITTIDDTTVEPDNTYSYRICAFNEFGESGFSEVATITIDANSGGGSATPTLSIGSVSSLDSDDVYANEPFLVDIDLSAPSQIESVDYFIDGIWQSTETAAPFDGLLAHETDGIVELTAIAKILGSTETLTDNATIQVYPSHTSAELISSLRIIDLDTNTDLGNPTYDYALDSVYLNDQIGQIGDRKDTHHFAYFTATSDFTFIASLELLQSDSPRAQTGLMIRSSLNSNSDQATILADSAGYISLVTRNGRPGVAQTTALTTSVTDFSHFKLDYQSGQIVFSLSNDRKNWIQFSTLQIDLGGTPYAGLALASNSDLAANSIASFRSLALEINSTGGSGGDGGSTDTGTGTGKPGNGKPSKK